MELFSEIAVSLSRVFVACIIVVGAFRLFFKNTVIYHFVAVMCFPIALSVLIGALVARGVVPALAGIPLAMAAIVVGFVIIGKVIQTPLKEMLNKLNSLSKGDLNFTFDKRFLKGKHELAEMSRKILQLGEAQKKTVEFAMWATAI